jgi:localization factor PodJL
MIEMARRAAEKGRAEADSPAGARPEKKAKAGTLAGLMLGGEAGKAVAGVRPGVLIVTSLAAFLLAGYWFLSGPKLGLPGAAGPSAIERTETPSGQPSGGEQPAPETEREPSAVKPAPGEQAPSAQPKRSSDEVPWERPRGAQQEASTDAAPAPSASHGMAVAFGPQAATVEHVIQARERARLASLSQRTGFAAARSYPAPPDASPVVTASIPSAPAPAGPAAAPAAPAASGRQLALPPAAAGPLSLRLAAAQGDSSAQLEIATRLAEGKGVKQSFAEAALWYERAAAQGEGVAQYRLATLYERGMGVKVDRERARALYRQAAEQGNVKAMHNLAVMGVSTAAAPDYAAAATLFGKAASHGLPDSQYNLGILYESGLGVPKDHAAAYRWYALAARSGDREAARRRDLLIARLPAESIEASNAQIASWQPVPAIERANDARVAGEAWKQSTADARR